MANYMQYQVSALATWVMPQLNIDVAGFNMLFLMPMLTAVFLSIPIGALGDRFGSRRVVGICLIISVIGGFLRCFFLESFEMQLLTMFLLGCGISALNANLVKVLGVWFKEQTGTAMGLFYASSCVAIVVAQVCAPLFGSVYNSYLVAAIVLAISTVLWYLLDRDVPKGETPAPPEPTLEYLKVAGKSKGVWLIAIGVGFGLASTTAYAGLLPQALELGKGVEMTTSGVMAAIVTVGSFFGCLIGPACADKIGKFKGFLVSTTIIGALFMFVTWYCPSVGWVIWFVLVANGFFTAINGPIMQAMPILLPEIGEKYAGSAGGIVGTVSLLISYFVPIIISVIAGDSYAVNFALESLCFVLGVIPIVLLPELGPKGKFQQELKAKRAAELGNVAE
jgi:NNP family nitrate/nitrite transporter-like MFS transporter